MKIMLSTFLHITPIQPVCLNLPRASLFEQLHSFTSGIALIFKTPAHFLHALFLGN